MLLYLAWEPAVGGELRQLALTRRHPVIQSDRFVNMRDRRMPERLQYPGGHELAHILLG